MNEQKKYTVLSLSTRNVVGSGWQVYADIPETIDAVEYKMRQGEKTVLIGYAPWTSPFAPKEWEAFIGELFSELVRLWNEKHGRLNNEIPEGDGMKKFRLWIGQIEEVEVERETDNSVWIKGRRYAKKADGYGFFDSYDEAWTYLYEHHERECNMARKTLDYRLERLEEIKAMRK